MDKQIIIDGVNVGGCSYYNPLGNYNCGGTKKCSQWSNCYFKQLARKTQEYKQKEKELKELKRQYKLSCLDCEYKNTKTDADSYRKALEEIEEYSNTYFDKEVSKEIFDIISKAKEGKDENT